MKAILLSGRNGTKPLLTKHSDRLACVRYRYDKARQKEIKTVELIVDEQDRVSSVTMPEGRRAAKKQEVASALIAG